MQNGGTHSRSQFAQLKYYQNNQRLPSRWCEHGQRYIDMWFSVSSLKRFNAFVFTLKCLEARIAIARATSVFIMYLSSNAAAMAHKQNHKTFNAQDVLDSINEMDFKSFSAPMKCSLLTYQKSMKDKKNNKKNSLEAQKSSGSQNKTAASIVQSPAVSVAPTKTVNHKTSTSNVHGQSLITISTDIIEIDDSD